jgi:serine/threonine protein kinase
MTPEQIDRVFGRARLRMVTGEHVEVFREAARAGDRRRYTKRFLNTLDADFGQWTEREWRILARLIGHGIDCVPEVVQFDRGEPGGTQLVQTYDAGATVDQWATLLPVSRESRVLRHVFEDCAHWWALAHHCLRALFAIHELSVVHLDIKGDNVCIPVGPPGFDPHRSGLRLYPRFAELALIDFAFALVSRESLTTALPIGWQTDYDYQSPRLLSALEAGRRGNLQPTRELDWRCDMYSLAAMLKRYLPDDDTVLDGGLASGWSLSRARAAKELILALRDAHDRETPLRRPHQELMQLTGERLADSDLAASLSSGWTLARDANVTPVAASPLTPLTRLAPSIRVIVPPREREPITAPPTVIRRRTRPAPDALAAPRRKSHAGRIVVLAALVAAGIVALAVPLIDSRWPAVGDALRSAVERVRGVTEAEAPRESPAKASGSAPMPEASMPQQVAADATPPEVPDPTPPEVPDPTPPEAPVATPPPALTSPARVAPASRNATTRTQRAATDAPRKTVQATSKQATPPAAGSRPNAVRLASAPPAPAQARIRFHVPDPAPSAIAQPLVEVAPAPTAPETPPPVTAPAPEPPRTDSPRPEAPAKPPSEPRVVQRPSPPVSTASALPPSAIAQDVRNVLGFLLGFARRSDRATAPIEDRVPQSSSTAPRSPPAESERVRETAPRPEPPRSVPVPADPTFAVVPAPAILPPREPAPRAMPPSEIIAQPRKVDGATTARTEQEVARVLWLASNASQPAQERAIVDALRRAWPSNTASSTSVGDASGIARRLSEDARQAYMVHRDVQGAFDLQLQAFGADSSDAEIAGNLAFLYLKLSPPQAETARRMAMHAIGINLPPVRATRVDDWHTLAVASALTGREIDATNALYVAIALTRSLDRSCKLALTAVDSYGDRLVAPVQAMMLRIRQRGREHESPSCTWPSRWQSAKGQF